MTQEEFIQKTMIALMSNPKVTNADNFDDESHHLRIHNAALYLSNTTDEDHQKLMYFDDLHSTSESTYPDGVSDLECFAAIAEALQAIANRKTIKEQQDDNDGNLERNEIKWK